MPARAVAMRGRARRGGGAFQWIALLAAAATIMGLTFALGILVGRQWSRPASATAGAESGGPRKTVVPPGKRGGLAGPDVEAPQVDQKQLTFYQTLTAPLGRGSADASQRARDKPKAPPAPEPARTEAPPPYPYTSRGETIVEKPPAPDATAPDGKTARPPADTMWAVQAAAFKTQAQADGLQKQLKQSGFDAYVVPAKGDDGQTTYRVRIGTFKSKADAQRTADRVRGERSLAAFITPK